MSNHDGEDWRGNKIRAGMWMKRLEQCFMGEVTLTNEQISCGKALINKVLPDLKAQDAPSTNFNFNYDAKDLSDEQLNKLFGRLAQANSTINHPDGDEAPKGKE